MNTPNKEFKLILSTFTQLALYKALDGLVDSLKNLKPSCSTIEIEEKISIAKEAMAKARGDV